MQLQSNFASSPNEKLGTAFLVVTPGLSVVFHPTHLAIIIFLLGAALIARLFTATISSAGIVALGLAVRSDLQAKSALQCLSRSRWALGLLDHQSLWPG